MPTKLRAVAAIGAVAVTCTGVWAISHSRAHADNAGSQATRAQVELTIYSDDFGMVHETRPLELKKGDNRLHVTDVSKMLDPESVSLEWKGQGERPEVVSQAYDLGVTTQDDLLKRFVGKQVELVRYGQSGVEAERQKGTLMVQSGGATVIQTDGSLYVNPPGTIVTPASEEIVTIPQLSVQADSPLAGKASLEVGYLTRGISWSADYVATLAQDSDTLNLQCWATVTNKTGVNYPNARVSLVTGSPNRAVSRVQNQVFDGHVLLEKEEKAKTASAFSSRGAMGGSFGAPVIAGEFHAYPISKPTSVQQEQMNRILMLSSTNVKTIKDYNTRTPAISAWQDEWNDGSSEGRRKGTVAVSMTFYNTEKNGLGQPLPHGDLRIYEPDGNGSLRYIGAASVQDTPLDQRIDLTLASAFDLTTEWRTIKRDRIGKHLIRKTVELKIHNEKGADVKVRVVQSFQNGWKIVQEPLKHANLDSNEVQWSIPVKSKSTCVFPFTVDVND